MRRASLTASSRALTVAADRPAPAAAPRRGRASPGSGQGNQTAVATNGVPLRLVILGRRQLCSDCLYHLFERQLTRSQIRVVAGVDEVQTAFGEDQPPHVVIKSVICSYGLDHAALREICAQVSPVPVIVHVDVFDAATIRQIVQAGARGVLPTWLPPRLTSVVLPLVAAGETYVPSLDSAPSPGPVSVGVSPQQALSRLTPRQIAVLRLTTEGKSNKEIGRALGLGPNTIKFHVASLMDKLGVDNRVRLAVIASRLLPP